MKINEKKLTLKYRAKTFYFASLFLPTKVKKDIENLYIFCRFLDDLGDDKNLSKIEKRGYSQAVIDGISASEGDYVLCTDSDNQIKVKSLIDNIKNFPKNGLFLIGFRNPRNCLLYTSDAADEP